MVARPEAFDLTGGLEHAWTSVAAFVPKLVAFLVILIVGYFVAKLVAKILVKVLQRVGFDRLVERGGVKQALDRSEYDAATILAKIVFYAIMLFVLSAAFGVFGSNPISGYLHAIVAYLPLVFIAIVIVVVAAAIAAAVKTLIVNSLGGLSYGSLLGNLASGFILALGIIAALDQLHIAARIVDAILYAVLATIVGVAIVAVGGGGISAMSQRWRNVLQRYDEEKPRFQQATSTSPSPSDQTRQAAPAAATPRPPAAGQPSSSGSAGFTEYPPSGGAHPSPPDTGYPPYGAHRSPGPSGTS